MSVYTIYYTN